MLTHCLQPDSQAMLLSYQLSPSLLFPLEPKIQPQGLLPKHHPKAAQLLLYPQSKKSSVPSPPAQSLTTLMADCKCHLLHET